MDYILNINNFEYKTNEKNLLSLIIFNTINSIHHLCASNSKKLNINKDLPDIKITIYNSFFKCNEDQFDYKSLSFPNIRNDEILTTEIKKKLTNLIGKNLDTDNNIQQNDPKEELASKIKMLETKKKNLEAIKKEKEEEMFRKFDVDYEIYTKKYSLFKDDVPDIFKFKFEVFEEMSKVVDINDKDLCKSYYIKNYNRINKNIGSDTYSKIFSQKEKEECEDN